MSRTLSAPLTSHIAASAHTLCSMLRLDLLDGTTLAFTDHDRTLAFDLGDGSADYQPHTGILPSDVSLSTGFEADDYEVTGPIGDIVTRIHVLGGRYDDARARLFQVNWNSLGSGAIKIMPGVVVMAEVLGGKFKLTVHSDMSRYSQSTGEVLTPYCRTYFGSTKCTVTPVEDDVTVTAVTSARTFTVGNPEGRVDGFFNTGLALFTGGDLAGIRAQPIDNFTAAGVLTMFEPLPEPPQVGDALTLRQGCYDPATGASLTRAACMSFDNMVNFRAEPDVPGSDKILPWQDGSGA